jgi:ABC-2 type transport system ATP-binding protein
LAALSAAGIGIEDFSMGSPSLDEVFFAHTGQPVDEEGARS